MYQAVKEQVKAGGGVRAPTARVAKTYGSSEDTLLGKGQKLPGTGRGQEAAELHPRARGGSLENHIHKYAEEAFWKR